MNIPTISKKDMTKLDQLMVEKYKIGIIQMMELAGFNTAELSRRILKRVSKKHIVILCGKGNNGGDGLCAARYLYNWRAKVTIFLITDDLKAEPLHHLNIIKKTSIPIIKALNQLENKLSTSDLIIDALLGYNINGPPRPRFAKAIELANTSKKPILSVDIPSGMTPEGLCQNPCINPSYTLALSLPKQGSKTGNFGINYIADMGVLPEVFKDLKIKVPNIFKDDFIVKI
jgi:NAD(P)H-hydrate epimerase